MEGKVLFGAFGKRKRHPGQVGVSVAADGVAVARVTREAGVPVLGLCEYRTTTDLAEQDAILQQLVSRNGLGGAQAVSIMPSGSFVLLLINTPEVPQDELKPAVRWRIKDLLDFHIDDTVIDVFDIPGQQERGRPKMMYAVAAHQSRVQDHIQLIERSGLRLEAVDIPELAQRNLAALLPEDENGVALLRFERNTGLLTLTKNKNLYLARNLDMGIEQLVDAAGEPHGEDMPEALRDCLDGVVLEVQRSFDYYESHFGLPPLGGLVVAPLGREIHGLVNYLAVQLGIPVRMLELDGLLESSFETDELTQSRCLPALGAALRREESTL